MVSSRGRDQRVNVFLQAYRKEAPEEAATCLEQVVSIHTKKGSK